MKKCTALLLVLMMILPFAMAHGETTRIIFWHSMSEEAGVLMDEYVKNYNDTIGVRLN